jgi:hypothetical protein
MSDNDNGLFDELGHELRRRADGLPPSPLTLGDVKGRAGSIRRTRRLATVAGLAAVVAIVVPVAVFAGGGDRADGPLPATHGPSAPQVPSESPTRAVDPAPPEPTDAPTHALNADHPVGAAPAVPWLDGTTLTRPGLDPVELPQPYDQFVVVSDRIVAVRSDDNGNRTLDVLRADGVVTSSVVAVVDGVVASPSGKTAAWATPDGNIETLWADDQVQLNGAPLGQVSAAAVLGDGSCYEVDGGCQVFLNREGKAPEVADSHGIVDTVVPGAAVRIEDVSSTGLVGVMRTVSDDGSCSGVFDEQHRAYLWKTCDYSFLGFSPGSTLLAATGAYRDGFGLTYVSVLDAGSGAPLAEFRIDGGAILQTAWEDESHLLAVTYDDRHGWRVLRLGLDGTVETAVASDRASQDDRPYFLAGAS